MVKSALMVTDADRQAGLDYLKALRRLHFEPDVMCWIYEMEGWHNLKDVDEPRSIPERKHLAIVSNLVDYAGAKAIYDLLFQAYDAAVTPKEIDPFIVHMFSPDSVGGRTLFEAASNGTLLEAKETGARNPDAGALMLSRNFFDIGAVFSMMVPTDGIIVVRRKGFDSRLAPQRFREFKRQVDALAA